MITARYDRAQIAHAVGVRFAADCPAGRLGRMRGKLGKTRPSLFTNLDVAAFFFGPSHAASTVVFCGPASTIDNSAPPMWPV